MENAKTIKAIFTQNYHGQDEETICIFTEDGEKLVSINSRFPWTQGTFDSIDYLALRKIFEKEEK